MHVARGLTVLLSVGAIVACGSSSSSSPAGPDAGSGGGSGADGGTGGRLDSGAPSTDGGVGVIDGGALPPAPTLPAALACNAPVGLADVSKPTTVLGAGSCTAAALTAAVAKGGVITFDCGAPTTLTLAAPLVPPRTIDTVIDGGGQVTLDGGGTSRILTFNGGAYDATRTTITLQNLTLQNGHATGTPIPVAPAPCSQGYSTDAGGGAVWIVDGVLHVVNDVFTGNAAQTPGPDVGGGAIYANGSLGVVVVGSRFAGNTGANGGALGMLDSTLSVYSSTFAGNTATGSGQNTNDATRCPSTTSHEIGDGGSGGAIYLDGGSDGDTTLCGDVFSTNHANALGGALFRVFDKAAHAFAVSATTFDGNVAEGPAGTTGAGSGAGAFYVHNGAVTVDASTLSHNSSVECGATQTDTGTMAMTNVTLSGNVATAGVGGAVCVFSGGGAFTNCTFGENQALGGNSFSDYDSAAVFGTVALTNTILADNRTMNDKGRMTCGATDTGTHDLQWPTTKPGGSMDTPCVTGIPFADPVLGSLGGHGGPTETYDPGAAASVLQVGAGCPATDQTGAPRATPCTIGAVEVAR